MPNLDILTLIQLAKRVRRDIITSTTQAGSGHPTSSLSAVDLIVTLMFGGFFQFDTENPDFLENDRLIFSKGHAAPLFYALYAAAGVISPEELLTLRQFTSRLEGHPTRRFPFTEVPTGSLGQGLSVGVGMALNAQHDHLSYRTFVLLGDSEMAEGSNWEAMQLASYYKLGNLIGILDVNRLGQRGETMYGHDVENYQRKIEAFGWRTKIVDGHSFEAIAEAFSLITQNNTQPLMIIAKTQKGKGFSLWENQEGWHSKSLNQDQLQQALAEIGDVQETTGQILKPFVQPEVDNQISAPTDLTTVQLPVYDVGASVATKRAVVNGIFELITKHPEIVVLDAEVSNSTHLELIQKNFPQHFYEMFIAEQNMVGVAAGLARRGKYPIVSTFAAFFTRAFDQIRMASQAELSMMYLGSYAGVSIGKDGPSQMGLEDLALFRSLWGSVVLYPADAYSAEKMAHLAFEHKGPTYIRTTREPTPSLYLDGEEFHIGGSKVVQKSDLDIVTLIGAGITVHEAIKAYDELKKIGITARVIDLYSIKPIDHQTLEQAINDTQALVVVEDHYPEGGIAEAIRSEVTITKPFASLAVRKLPRSGTPAELLDYEEISAPSIVAAVRSLLQK